MSDAETIIDATIEDLAAALSSWRLTSVDLVAKYLLRISTYDCRNTTLNSIPLINEDVFDEAARSDDRRLAGDAYSLLDGIPFTVKDSYKVKGMSVSSGSEAFKDLVANEDAFTVGALREHGAVLLGKTNMCPMAYGGMLRGLYGRAESPYNPKYLAAAFGSGSSNGSGASTAASFAAFGMGEETVSSGRSPASNNALVAYTPSRGIISIRGNWPLYPTCDVVVPHTRSMDDLLILMDVLVKQDGVTAGDFWRDQPFITLPRALSNQPATFAKLKNSNMLQHKRIAVPLMYVKQSESGTYISSDVEALWTQAKVDLEGAGATVEIIRDFPVMQIYTKLLSSVVDDHDDSLGLPRDWNTTERGVLIAHAWEDFLQTNKDPCFPSVKGIDPRKIFPHLSPDDPQVRFTEPANAVHWSRLASYVENRISTQESESCIYDIPQLENAVKALEAMRKQYFEDWLDKHHFDFVAFPAAGDVAQADSDINYSSAEHAWRDGVKYSHGNRMLRHLGIPSVTVPMGLLKNSMMPMGLTFLGRAYDDVYILSAAYAYEHKSRRRTVPPYTPPLITDVVQANFKMQRSRPHLTVSTCSVSQRNGNNNIISIKGTVSRSRDDQLAQDPDRTKLIVQVYIDGVTVPDSQVQIVMDEQAADILYFACQCSVPRPPLQDQRNTVLGEVARDSTMIMIVARDGEQGRPTGFVKLIHASA